jgi:hypothetical protein
MCLDPQYNHPYTAFALYLYKQRDLLQCFSERTKELVVVVVF